MLSSDEFQVHQLAYIYSVDILLIAERIILFELNITTLKKVSMTNALDPFKFLGMDIAICTNL